MTKIHGLLRSILILCLFLTAKVEKAEAFFLIPPLPPEPVVDFPDEGGKIVSVAQAAYQKVQSIQSRLATLRLDAIKKGDLFAIKQALGTLNALTEDGKKKSPNKDAVKPSDVLGIKEADKGMLDEEAFFNAYNTLFFTYPSLAHYTELLDGGKKADYAFMQTIYESKADLYRQDMLIDTYLTARLMEDYLVTVERTINRLDACQKNPDPEKCSFFGMTMAEVKSTDEAPQGGENDNNPGQIGAATNAYIVTMVYDRLMRLVEDLTATEALYQAAKQTDKADPVFPKGSESSAEDYIPLKYQFSYTETHEHSYAEKLINEEGFKRLECEPGKDGCPAINKEAKAKDLMDDTEILTKLQPLDNLLTEAITIHNIKNQLPAYKVQYRQYLRAIEIHKRALQAVYDSDQCIVDFFSRHAGDKTSGQNWGEYWGTAKGVGEQKTEDGHVFAYEKDYNNYTSRGGLSLALIRDYQTRTENTILGTSNACEGYYPKGQCADGYKSDEKKPCSEDKSLYPCVLENAVEFDATTPSALDTDEMSKSLSSDDEKSGVENLAERQKGSLSFDEKDYISSNDDLENIANDNRVRTETPWRIGAEQILKMTESGELKFDPWNDQKDLQVNYLRQKYHNITNIIKTTDQGTASFKIAKALSENIDGSQSEEEAAIESLVKGFSTCYPMVTAVKEAYSNYCTGYGSPSETKGETVTRSGTKTDEMKDTDSDGAVIYKDVTLTCKVEGNKKTGKITYTKEVVSDDKWSINTETDTDDQYYSKNDGLSHCRYNSGAPSSDDGSEGAEGDIKCTDIWDFTKGFLVKRYLRCAVDDAYELDSGEKFYKVAGKDKGRRVAFNRLENVVKQRIASEKEIAELVEDYNKKQEIYAKVLKEKKQLMTSYNKDVDTATKDKNLLKKLQDKSQRRINSIKDEIANIREREAKVNLESDKCSLEYRIAKLELEMSCIENGVGGFACPSYCAGLKVTQQPEGCADAAKAPKCSDYITTVREAMSAQKTIEDIETLNNQKAEGETTTPIPESVKKVADKYIVPELANPLIAKKDEEIEDKQTLKKAMQEEVKELQKTINAIAEAFMNEDGAAWEDVKDHKIELPGAKGTQVSAIQASYIVTSQNEQDKIEERNEDFEGFLNREEKYRMSRDGEKDTICSPIFNICRLKGVGSDNLKTSLNVFFGNAAEVNEIKNRMKNKWVDSQLEALDKANNELSPFSITIDGSFEALLGLPAGEITWETMRKKIEDQIVLMAAKEVRGNIETGDTIIKEELASALLEVKGLTDKYHISGDESDQEHQIPEVAQLSKIMEHDNYKDKPEAKLLEVAGDHDNLMTSLRTPLSKYAQILQDAGINLGELLGISDEIENTVGSNNNNPKDKYFVGLPARGANYQDFLLETQFEDGYAGKDYMSPNGPLMNLPPLREVFYFDAEDYQDLPAKPGELDDKRDAPAVRPSITHLLNKKFPTHKDGFVASWEYMPEIWRYLLARPNARDDGLYQQAFIENSYPASNLHDMLGGDGKNADYGRIIAREGVYPCLMGNTAIDVKASTRISDARFVVGNSPLAVRECNEIASNKLDKFAKIISQENLCYLYNKKSNGVCHLLADHGKGKDIDTLRNDSNIKDYSKYSELGQFLQAGLRISLPWGVSKTIADNNLFYRDMQKNIADYLTDEDSSENNIQRQHAELSSFKRNILGSFLEAVYSEHSAKKTRDNMRKTVLASLQGLCKQIHQNGRSVSELLKDENYKGSNAEARDEMDKACAIYLTDGEGGNKPGDHYAVGLAFSKLGEKDTQYGVSEEFTKDQDLFGGISCSASGSIEAASSYYEGMFCNLDAIKAEKLSKAKTLEKEAEDLYKKLIEKAKKEKNPKDYQYVLDRLTDIKDYIKMLETDEYEVVFLTPNMKKGKHNNTLEGIDTSDTEANIQTEVGKAKANRTVERATDEESITGMDNGTQSVPYCPNY